MEAMKFLNGAQWTMIALAALTSACASEPTGTSTETSNSKTEPVTTVCTPAMPVSSKKILSSHVIKAKLASPFLPAVFLADVTIAEATSITGVTGTMNPGTDSQHGGTVSLLVSSAVYSNLADFMTNHTGLVLTICYDDTTLIPNDVSCGTTQP
jgi:hypothetical protein